MAKLMVDLRGLDSGLSHAVFGSGLASGVKT